MQARPLAATVGRPRSRKRPGCELRSSWQARPLAATVGGGTHMPAWMDDDLQEQRRRGLYRSRRQLESGQGVEVRWRLRDHLNFSSNDYLAYAGDPRLARAAARAAYRFGCGAGASPLVSGYHPLLRVLERDLADWQQTESALVFSSGFAGNLAVVSALAGKTDAIFSDAANHASIIDGCRLSRECVHLSPRRHGASRGTVVVARARCSPQADRQRHRLQHGRRPGVRAGIAVAGASPRCLAGSR